MASAPKKTQEEIIQQFQRLRSEQRSIAVKISEIELDQNEHKLVMETLKDLDPKRRCFRMVGGVLVERDIGSVVPALKTNYGKIGELLVKLNEQLLTKGQEIIDYKEQNNIKIEGEKDDTSEKMEDEDSSKDKTGTQGVLV